MMRWDHVPENLLPRVRDTFAKVSRTHHCVDVELEVAAEKHKANKERAQRGAAIAESATEKLLWQIAQMRLPEPVREYRFHPSRRWRLDVAWPGLRCGVEIDGGLHGGQGRHIRPMGYIRDAEKRNALILAGWRVLTITHRQIRTGEAVRIVAALVGRA